MKARLKEELEKRLTMAQSEMETQTRLMNTLRQMADKHDEGRKLAAKRVKHLIEQIVKLDNEK